MSSEEILGMLDQSGIRHRNYMGAVKSTYFWHPDHPEIQNTIKLGTQNLAFQRIAIEACMTVASLESDSHATHGHNEYDVAKQDRRDAYQIPEDLEIIVGRKIPGTYLRHKEFPQIATEIPGGYEPGSDLSDYATYVEGRAKVLEDLLAQAENEKDFERTDYPNGTILLMHQAHPVSLTLYPFTPRNQNFTVHGPLEDAIAEVDIQKEQDDEHIKGLSTNYNWEELNLEDPATLSVRFKNPITGHKSDAMTIPKTPNGYVAYPNLVSLTHNLNASLWKNFRQNMREYWGVKMERAAEGVQKGTHPFVEGQFEIPNVENIAPPLDRLAEYEEMGTQGRDEFDRVMNEDLKMRMQATTAVIDALRTVQKSLDKAHKKSGNFENRHGNPVNTEGIRGKAIGTIVKAPYKTSKGEDFGQCDFLFTRKYGSNGFKYNISPESLKTLKPPQTEFAEGFQVNSSLSPAIVKKPPGELPSLTSFGHASGTKPMTALQLLSTKTFDQD